MEKGIIKIGDIVRFTDSFINDWRSLGLISEEDEPWWYEQHVVTDVGYESDNEEYVILDNDENTYTNTSGDNFIILN